MSANIWAKVLCLNAVMTTNSLMLCATSQTTYNSSEFEHLYTATNAATKVENLSSYLRFRQLYRQMHHKRSFESSGERKRRGMVTCAGDGQVSDVLKLIWTIESLREKSKEFWIHCGTLL